MATKVVKSTCQLDCPDACGMLVEVDEDSGRVVALRGNPEHPFTAGALCGKVAHSVDGLYGADRLTQSAGPSRGEGRGQVRAHLVGRGAGHDRRATA